MTLRTRLTAAFLAVVVVPLLVGVALLAAVLPKAFAERQDAAVTATSRLAATVVVQWCERLTAVAEAAGRAVAGPDLAGRQAALDSLVQRGLADGVEVRLGAAGTTTAGAVPEAAEACADGEPTVEGGAVSVAARVPLAAPAGAPVGVAVAVLEVDEDSAATLSAAANGAQVVLLAGNEAVAGASPPGDLVRRALAADGAVVRGGGRVATAVPAGPGQALGVAIVEAEAEGVGLLPTAAAVVAGAVVLASVIALLIARATARPLGELGDAAARIASGDLTTRLQVRSRDEVGRLAAAFNAMTDDLRRSVGALEASRDELHAGLTRLGDTLSGTHDLEKILSVVLETAMAATQAEAGGLLLLDPPPAGSSRSELRLAVARGLADRGTAIGFRIPLGLGISGRVAQDGEPLRGWVGDRLPAGPGEPRAESVLAVPLRGKGAQVLGVLVLYDRPGGFGEADLTTIRSFAAQAAVAIDNVLLHERAQRLSLTDSLTGLWNARYYATAIVQEIERATRFGRPLALVLLDVDRFVQVNDRYGRPRGDAVLVELAARLREQVRDVDTVVRYGGDELVVILPETDAGGAVQTAERLRNAVRRRRFEAPDAPSVHLTASLGVAVFPFHGTTPAELLARADGALHDARQAGRDTWRLAADPAAPDLSASPPEAVREPGPH